MKSETNASAGFSILDFGAAESAAPSANAAAIQAALDAAAAKGGGTVTVPPGTWNTGTIRLRSHVELRLGKGAVLKGSIRRDDYNANDEFPENFWSAGEEWSGGHLILGYRVEDVAITGEGVIDGNGPAFFGECEEDSRFPYYKYGLKLHPTDREWFRPGHMVAFFLSKGIRLEGVTLANTPAWTTHFRCCDGLTIRGVTIDADRTIANSDGFSIDCTRNVTVEGCTVRTGDDAFAIRASCAVPGHAEAHPCENIRIRDCDVWSCCMGVRFGIGTGTVRNVEVEDCRFHESAQGVEFAPAWIPGAKGVYIENIRVSRCDFLECATPVKCNARADDWLVRDVLFEDCRFASLSPISLQGGAGRTPERVTFRNCFRKCIDRVKVRHHRGWGEPRDSRFMDDSPVAGLVVENCRPAPRRRGALILSFDDRNFADWIAALPLFEKSGAHATFFVSGPINDEAVRAMKRLSEAGHSVGLHGLAHANADEALAAMGAERYWKEEIEPQLAACRVGYVPIRSFAYPNCRRTDETDELFRAKGFAHMRGGHQGVAPYDPEGVKQEGLAPIHTVDRAFLPVSELSSRFRLDTVIAGEAYHTDIEDLLACVRRSAERNEAFVLTSHGIHADAKGIHMKTEWLERILATAEECGVAVIGFDEL